jgi:hypothetical protein
MEVPELVPDQVGRAGLRAEPVAPVLVVLVELVLVELELVLVLVLVLVELELELELELVLVLVELVELVEEDLMGLLHQILIPKQGIR